MLLPGVTDRVVLWGTPVLSEGLFVVSFPVAGALTRKLLLARRQDAVDRLSDRRKPAGGNGPLVPAVLNFGLQSVAVLGAVVAVRIEVPMPALPCALVVAAAPTAWRAGGPIAGAGATGILAELATKRAGTS